MPPCATRTKQLADVADALDSKSTIILGRDSVVAISLPKQESLFPVLRIALESPMIGPW